MKKTHTTRQGQVVLIAAMEDSHLYNFLRFMFGKIGEIKSRIVYDQKDALKRQLTAQQFISVDEGAKAIEMIMDTIAPYLIEAYLRGISGIQKMLQEAMERDGKVQDVAFLPYCTFDDDDDENGGMGSRWPDED